MKRKWVAVIIFWTLFLFSIGNPVVSHISVAGFWLFLMVVSVYSVHQTFAIVTRQATVPIEESLAGWKDFRWTNKNWISLPKTRDRKTHFIAEQIRSALIL